MDIGWKTAEGRVERMDRVYWQRADASRIGELPVRGQHGCEPAGWKNLRRRWIFRLADDFPTLFDAEQNEFRCPARVRLPTQLSWQVQARLLRLRLRT